MIIGSNIGMKAKTVGFVSLEKIIKNCLGIDAMFNTIDKPLTIGKAVSGYMLYVFGIDHGLKVEIYKICLDFHVRDLTARYASDYLTKAFRSLRTDENWIKETFGLTVKDCLFLIKFFRCSLEI